MKENRNWFGLPNLMGIFSQETSTWWKGHNNTIWFQTKDDLMMELDRSCYVEYKSRNWNPALYLDNYLTAHSIGIIRDYHRKDLKFISYVSLIMPV